MNFDKPIKISIFKAENSFNNNGKPFLKCNFRYSSKQFSEKKNKEFKLQEIIWNAEIYSCDQTTDEILNKMLELEKQINENKKLPPEERNKRIPSIPTVKIYANDYDIISYYFPQTKKSLYKFIIKQWSFEPVKSTSEEESKKIESLQEKLIALKKELNAIKLENRNLKKELIKKDIKSGISYDAISSEPQENNDTEDDYEDDDDETFDYPDTILF